MREHGVYVVLPMRSIAERRTLPPSGRGPDADTVVQAFALHDITPIGPSLTEDEALVFASRL